MKLCVHTGFRTRKHARRRYFPSNSSPARRRTPPARRDQPQEAGCCSQWPVSRGSELRLRRSSPPSSDSGKATLETVVEIEPAVLGAEDLVVEQERARRVGQPHVGVIGSLVVERAKAQLAATQENAFAYFGGRCETLLYERLRTAVLGTISDARPSASQESASTTTGT